MASTCASSSDDKGTRSSGRWLSKDVSELFKRQSELIKKHPELEENPGDSPSVEIYDLVIIGSGYGGAMAAAEFANAKNEFGQDIKVCVLERGKEYLPGAFPSQLAEMPGHVRVSTPNSKKPSGYGDALFDVRIGPDVCALVACGLGGGSLINAAVMKVPVLKKGGRHFSDTLIDALNNIFPIVKQKLGSVEEAITRHPDGAINGPLSKTLALKSLHPDDTKIPSDPDAQKIFEYAALTIETTDLPGPNLTTCSLCGDCMTGCNIGAKKSLDTNLLLIAAKNGVEIFTGASVLKLKRVTPSNQDTQKNKEVCWQIEVVYSDNNLRIHQGEPLQLHARKVILAAGALGSPEILLRSQSNDLQFSARLGKQFSCNGDNIATFYKLKVPVNTVADEATPLISNLGQGRRVGPTITSMLNIPKSGSKEGFLIQEFAVPAPLRKLFEETVTTSNILHGLTTADCSRHLPATSDEIDPCAVDPEAIKHSALIGIVGHDKAEGVLRLDPKYERSQNVYDGMLQISWPDARNGESLDEAIKYLEHLGQGKHCRDKHCKEPENKNKPLQDDGRVLPNPLWKMVPDELESLAGQPKGPVLTVHPLGGCPIGDDLSTGAVNDHGIVYDCLTECDCIDDECKNFDDRKKKYRAKAEERDQWQGSLIVLDGSIIPTSLGANPALTIASLAYRACPILSNSWNWVLASEQTKMEARPDFPKRGVFRSPEDCTQAPGLVKDTEIQIAERLFGFVPLLSDSGIAYEDHIVELTLRYNRVAIKDLMTTLRRTIKVAENEANKPVSQLRIFSKPTWIKQRLAFANEKQRDENALFIAHLEGKLDLLNREATGGLGRIVRAGISWFINRGLRDIAQEFWEFIKKSPTLTTKDIWAIPKKLLKASRESRNLASHAGEVRRFDYKLTIGEIQQSSPLFKDQLAKGSTIEGEKRLTYSRRANPLLQLTRLKLIKFPSMSNQTESTLKLDMRYLALQEIPLAQIMKQENLVKAMAELGSFAMYISRLMLSIHLWTFRKPDAATPRTAKRLPGSVPGLPEPEIIEIDVAKPKAGIPVRVRLTRYRKDALNNELCPLVFIHGYSASGTTFAHHAIGTSMAKYFYDHGRDIWILDLRTSAGMPTATLHWDFEDAALEDIPVAIAHILKSTGKEKVDVFAHCIGAIMLSMAILVDPNRIDEALPHRQRNGKTDIRRHYAAELKKLPTSIRRIILSQKGPAVVYTADNTFRAYLMRFLRKLTFSDDFQFSVKENAPARDQLIDRLLNILPYPNAEYDKENPLFKSTPWVGFRHRMDALYARDFNVNNISDETLAYIEDFFGPLNLETVAQAIHFARNNQITNGTGRNTFVSRSNLIARWSKIECTMSIHGAKNGLADPETLNCMKDLMDDAGVAFKTKLFANMGHQDMLIGKNNTHVFKKIEAFLRDDIKTVPIEKIREAPCFLPWLGPQFRAHIGTSDSVWVMADPAHGTAQVICLPIDHSSPSEVYLVATDLQESICSTPAKVGVWTEILVPPALGNCKGVVLVLCYDETPKTRDMNVDFHFQNEFLNYPPISGMLNPLTTILQVRHPPDSPATEFTPEDLEKILLQLYKRYQHKEIALAFIDKDRLNNGAGASDLRASEMSFAFGSCQYPTGLIDRPMAEASYHRLAMRLALTPDKTKPELLLLLGDQIYSDATAGFLDPTRSDDRFQRPHEEWLRMKPVRDVMRQIPVYCMLDDHEIIDNWSPKKTGTYDWFLDQGRMAYKNYQPTPKPAFFVSKACDDLWVSFEHKGFSFFMADTRTHREARSASTANHAEIFDENQALAMQDWLLSCDKKRPKLISTASMLLPRHRAAESDLLNLDAWDAYPRSLHKLLSFILEQQIHHVIFLSGDEHLSCVSEITVTSTTNSPDQKNPVSILSIHSSALYAPLPFANTLPAALPEYEEFSFSEDNYSCKTKTTKIHKGDGYAIINLEENAEGVWYVNLEFDGREGTWKWPASPYKI